MRRFGFESVLLFLGILFVSGCCCHVDPCRTEYGEKNMGQLATLTRTAMDIVWSDHLGDSIPAVMPEPEILETIRRLNTDFEELKMLDRYEMVMVSDGKNLATVVWDPENDRKLIEDFRCTKKLDLAAWRECSFGKELSSGWDICH